MDEFDDFDDYADSGDSEDEDLSEAYCEAKEKKPSGSDDAVEAFELVLTLEQRDAQRTEWGFKALKQLLKLGAVKGSTDVLRNYKRILGYQSAVSDSQMEKACLKVLACVTDVKSFREFGQITNEALKDTKPIMWSRIAMRLATTLFTGGHDDDGLLVLAGLKNTVQNDARLVAFTDSLLLDVYKLEAEIRIRKGDVEQIGALHAAAESRQWAENLAAMAVINECFAVVLILKSQYNMAETELVVAAKIHADERSENALRCSQLLAMNKALQSGPNNYARAVLRLPQPTESRVLAASDLAQRYQTEHGDAFLTEAQKFLAEDTDPLVACVLEQWTSKVRKAQGELQNCLDSPRSDRFARLRMQCRAEPDAYIRKLRVTRAFAAELQYWLELGEDCRVRVVLNIALSHQGELSGRSFFEQGSLDYAQRSLRAALRHCSVERVPPCSQLLVLVGLLVGEEDEVIQQNLEESTLDVLRQLANHICTFKPADCSSLLSDADCLARVDPFIVKTLQEWVAKMEPLEECLREVEALQAQEKSDHSETMQRIEELKQKATGESNETVKFLCCMQLCAAELQVAYAAGDHQRLRRVVDESPLTAQQNVKLSEKVVEDRTPAAAIILEFDGRMKLMDREMAAALSAFQSAEKTYTCCGSKRLTACKQLVLFCRLVQYAAGGQDFPSTESADEALLELLVPFTAAIAKADLAAIRSIIDGPSFAELANNGLLDAVPKWLEVFEESNRILTTEGQVLVDGSDYFTLEKRLEFLVIPEEIFDKLTRDTWTMRLWSLNVHIAYHCNNNKYANHLVERLEELSVSVRYSEPAGIILEVSGKLNLRANDRPRALERFQQALQIFEINESDRRHAVARYIALTLRPNQPLMDHLDKQYASAADVVAIRDLMDAYYTDERDRFYKLMEEAQSLPFDAFVDERLEAHFDTLKARICSRPIQLPTEVWEDAFSMLRSERVPVQSTCKKFCESFANVFMPRR